MPNRSPWRWFTAAFAAGLILAPAAAGYADPGVAGLDRQIAEASLQLDTVVERYDVAEENLAATRRQIDDLTRRMVPARITIAAERGRLDMLVSGAYKTTPLGTLAVMLDTASPRVVLDQLATLERLARERDHRLRALLTAQATLDQQQRTLDALARQQSDQVAELAARKADIEARIGELTRMRIIAYGSAGPGYTGGSGGGTRIPLYTTDGASRAVSFAYQQIGKPYQWGSAGPYGYDCSGLAMAAWRAGGVALPHSSQMQWGVVTAVPASALRAGDLVFYYSDIHHVALYVGGGNVIHAPGYGETVTVARLDTAPVYGYGRPY